MRVAIKFLINQGEATNTAGIQRKIKSFVKLEKPCFDLSELAFNFSVGRGLIDTLLPVFTVQELGWADSGYSQVFAYANLTSGILGMFVAGAMIDFFGKIRMITIYIMLLISIIIGMSMLNVYWAQREFTIGFIFAYYILETFLVIAVFATAMQLCWKRISATQFTLFMAISNLGHSLGAALLGPLKEYLSWEYVILSFILFAFIMLVIVRFIHLLIYEFI